LGIGEAIVTVLSEKGAPTPVAWTRLRAPRSLMGTIGDDAIKQAAAASELHGRYSQTVDRESAYELMAARMAPPAPAPEQHQQEQPAPERQRREREEPGFVEKVMGNSAVKSFFRSAASALGRELTRGMFGNRRR
jgi:uncharacterized protein